jgi:hypothetical protein
MGDTGIALTASLYGAAQKMRIQSSGGPQKPDSMNLRIRP